MLSVIGSPDVLFAKRLINRLVKPIKWRRVRRSSLVNNRTFMILWTTFSNLNNRYNKMNIPRSYGIYPLISVIAVFIVFNVFILKFPELELSFRMCNRPEQLMYGSNALRKIFMTADRNALGKRLPFETIARVRELSLNKRKRGKRGGVQNSNQRRLINHLNLISIQMGNDKPEMTAQSINIGTVNCRSIKPKEELVHDLIEEQTLDITVLTETWLNNDDQIWKKTCDLNRNNLALHTKDRKNKRGGGIAFVLSMMRISKVQEIEREEKLTYESMHMQITVQNRTYNVLGMYRPPHINLVNFTDELVLDLQNFLTQYRSVIIL